MHKHGYVAVLIALSLIGGGVAAQQQTPAVPAAQALPPPGPGLDLINARCGFCHSIGQVFEKPHSKADWAAIVQGMADRGAEISPEEMQVITDYLVDNYALSAGDVPAGTPG